MDLNELKTLWVQHESAEYPPGCFGIKGGCNLLGVDSELRAAFISWIESGRAIIPHRRVNLEKNAQSLMGALEQLPEGARPYFRRVLALSRGLLDLQP